MKKLLIQALFAVSIFFAFNVSAADNNEEMLKEINHFGNALDKCSIKHKEKLQQCSKEKVKNENCFTTSYVQELISLSDEVRACYKNLGKEIILTFYKNNQKTMLKDFYNYIEITKNIFLNVYADADSCIGNCGLIIYWQRNQAANDTISYFLITMLKNQEVYYQF